MAMNVTVRITNYKPADTYTIELYKRNATTPVATKQIPQNAGSVWTFYNVEEADYDALVRHICNETTKEIRKPVSSAGGCSCPSGYTINTDNTKCVKVSTTAAQLSTLGELSAGAGPNDGNYNSEGARVYLPGYTVDGQGAVQWDSGQSHAYWASFGDVTKGRLNIAGVWNSADNSAPLNQWIGFAYKINVPTSKVYYIGMSGDNYIRFKVNGRVVVDQQQYAAQQTDLMYNFHYWHIYPVYLSAGENYLELEGYNTGAIGCFAAEIYDCTLDKLQTVTPGTESLLGRLFTTLGATTFDSKYFCADGWALDNSDPANPVCKKVEYVPCNP